MTRIQYYHRLSEWISPYWKMLSLAFFSMVIMALTMSALPIVIKQVLDETLAAQDQELMKLILLAIIILFIIRGVASYISIRATNTMSRNLGLDLRTAMFDKLLTLPTSSYNHLNDHNISARFICDINQITSAVTSSLNILTKDALTIAGLITGMFYLNWELSLLMLLITPMIILITKLVHEHINQTSQKVSQASKELSQSILNSIRYFRTIRLYGGQLNENQRFSDKAAQIQFSEMQQTAITALIIPLGQVMIVIILTAIAYLTAQQMVNGEITLQEICALTVATLLIIMPIRRALSINQHLQLGQKAASNICSLLDQEVELDTGTNSINHIDGMLSFEQISFCYDTHEQLTLNNISFTINASKTTALIGSTDHENTVLIDLILRFHRPKTGQILLDGYDLADLKLSQLHANISIISPDEALLGENIAANIAYGTMKCAHEAEITGAAQAAHAIEFIREMPEGLQTQIDQNSNPLSQKQRLHIAIARAILKNPPILILNGIPTATTFESESDLLHDALETLIQGRTTLILTHHLPTLEKADQIIVFNNGNIAETGTHQELLTKKGNYTQFVQTHSDRNN